MDLPGYEEAKQLGYNLYAHSGNQQSATYMKGPLALDVWYAEDGLKAKLSAQIGLITITAGELSFPHRLFEKVFEKQIQQAYDGAKDAMEARVSGLSL